MATYSKLQMSYDGPFDANKIYTKILIKKTFKKISPRNLKQRRVQKASNLIIHYKTVKIIPVFEATIRTSHEVSLKTHIHRSQYRPKLIGPVLPYLRLAYNTGRCVPSILVL